MPIYAGKYGSLDYSMPFFFFTYGLFASHSATTVKFSFEKIV